LRPLIFTAKLVAWPEVGTEAVWDELPSGPPPRARRRFWPGSISEAGAAFATFALSLTVFSVAGLNAIRGPEITLIAPERMLLYREGEGDAATLTLALNAGIINEASGEFGDVMTGAELSFAPPADKPARFGLGALVELVNSPVPRAQRAEWVSAQVRSCDVGVRCVATANALIIEREKRLLDVPGAGSRTEKLGFLLQTNQCAGPAALCAEFDGYRKTLATLKRQGQLRAYVTLRFNRDGEKRLACFGSVDPRKIDAVYGYLEDNGWATFACEAPPPRRFFSGS
jgi:hypothetical protein